VAGCEGHRRHCIWKGFGPKVKTAGPGIRIGGRSQYNRPTFCFVVGLPHSHFRGDKFLALGGIAPFALRWLRACRREHLFDISAKPTDVNSNVSLVSFSLVPILILSKNVII